MILAQLDDRWRVVHHERQWILQTWNGNKWRDRSYCVTKSALLRCIREYCQGDVDLEAVKDLPDWHPDRAVRPLERGYSPKEPRVAPALPDPRPLVYKHHHVDRGDL